MTIAAVFYLFSVQCNKRRSPVLLRNRLWVLIDGSRVVPARDAQFVEDSPEIHPSLPTKSDKQRTPVLLRNRHLSKLIGNP
jgi:hypothetical protein